MIVEMPDSVRAILEMLSDGEVHELSALCPLVGLAVYSGCARVVRGGDGILRRIETARCAVRITEAGRERIRVRPRGLTIATGTA